MRAKIHNVNLVCNTQFHEFRAGVIFVAVQNQYSPVVIRGYIMGNEHRFQLLNGVGADGPNRRTVKRMCVNECIVVIQSFFYLRT
jgi:hypothetical protein